VTKFATASDLVEDLVCIPSVNPEMAGTGEAEVAQFIADLFEQNGIDASLIEVLEGRPNVIATLPGADGTPTLLFEAHLDTVSLPPSGLEVRVNDGRLYGRGACDTKGSAAAMIVAMFRLSRSDGPRPTVVFAGVIDEETVMTGSRSLLDQVPRVDAAVVGEPTSLRPVRAHNGLARFRVTAKGASAHTSVAHLGKNAVLALSAFIARAAETVIARCAEREHPLTGRALLTPAIISGGTAPNLVPDCAEVVFDRRIAPGESVDGALAAIDEVIAWCAESGHELLREEPFVDLPPVEVASNEPIIAVTESAVEAVVGRRLTATGVPYGTDASNLTGRGSIPSVVVGPGSIDQAHTDDEWVSLDEVEQAVEVYVGIARSFAASFASHTRREPPR
jgi:succinyl-diaminopimelate desuccinylase